jgi:hypothetical protein
MCCPRTGLQLIALWSIVLGLLFWNASLAQVSDEFSEETLNDRYGFHVIAFSTVGTQAIPFAISGYYRFHGDGKLTGQDVVSATGPGAEVIHREYEGTYEVNADGTGTLVLEIAPSFRPRGFFTIVKGGEAVEIVFAVEGNANAFTLRKQNTD